MLSRPLGGERLMERGTPGVVELQLAGGPVITVVCEVVSQLLRSVRARPELAKTPFILVSAAKPRGSEEADQYLPKPVGLETFEKAVQAGLAAAPRKQRPEPSSAGLTTAEESALSLAREEMFTWVAHEIKTPLSSAKMNTQLIQRHLQALGDQTQLKRSEAVLMQLDRMDALVISVLEAAKLAEGRVVLHRERHDLTQLVSSWVTYWRKSRPDFELAVTLPKEQVILELDAERVRQVFDNLVSNAVKYAHPSKRIEFAVVPSPATVEIRVRDFGPGIEAAELPRIFGRFHRGAGVHGEGHGLGLFIAAALTWLHGGTLKIRTGTGLDVYAEPAAAVAVAARWLPSALQRSRRMTHLCSAEVDQVKITARDRDLGRA